LGGHVSGFNDVVQTADINVKQSEIEKYSRILIKWSSPVV